MLRYKVSHPTQNSLVLTQKKGTNQTGVITSTIR